MEPTGFIEPTGFTMPPGFPPTAEDFNEVLTQKYMREGIAREDIPKVLEIGKHIFSHGSSSGNYSPKVESWMTPVRTDEQSTDELCTENALRIREANIAAMYGDAGVQTPSGQRFNNVMLWTLVEDTTSVTTSGDAPQKGIGICVLRYMGSD